MFDILPTEAVKIYKAWLVTDSTSVNYFFSVPTNDDPIKNERSPSGIYSFVTSQDPKIGYWIPKDKGYIYKIRCKTFNKCSFEKVTVGMKLGMRFVAMSVPENHGFKCA